MNGSQSHKKNTSDASFVQGQPVFRWITFHTFYFHPGRKYKAILCLIYIYSYSTWCTYSCCFIHQNRTMKIIQCKVNVQNVSLNKRTILDFTGS